MSLSPPSIFSLLPLDMLDVILRHVRGSDLASVCRTSRLFRTHALTALYRDLLLTDNRSLNACFSIIDDPSLAARVKCLAIHSDDAGSFYGVIQETLALLPNLQALELFFPTASAQWILPISSCPFQLHTFLTDFQYTSDVGTFIASQHSLKKLTVPWSGGRAYTGNLEFLGLRYLTKIFAPFTLVEALVPGRPIREVKTFRDALDIYPDRVRCLAESTVGVERLHLNIAFLLEIGPELLAATLPSLSCLAIIVDDEYKEPEEQLMVWISSFLARFPPLHCFNVRLDMRLPWQMMEHQYLTALSSTDQELQYFAVSALSRSRSGYAGKRVGKRWTECSSDEAAWVLAHSIN
ncbi:hypothetical protein B0H13DRAFT_901990 [Mycena leptocephala]|nr:hypothetical protein B0H13DRAFT_901990 [Mycena leptocephala]